MRWTTLMVAAALLCSGGEGWPQDGAVAEEPGFACRLPDGGAGLAGLDGSGDRWLDQRVRSESGFLKSLLGVEAELVMLGADAPADAFVARGPDGAAIVGFRAGWLIDRCSQQESHRAARVAYALAHEYAHVLQWKRGCPLPEIARERQADLIAGWFLGRRNIATLKGDPPLARDFTADVFKLPDPRLNARFEHGTPEMRADAVAEGFRLWRAEKLSIKQLYERGLQMYPPPKVGVSGAPENTPLPADTSGLTKVECTHPGPCHHEVACRHPQPCVHKVTCQHLGPCVHRTPCIHQVACVHRTPCIHRTDCKHKVPCVHAVPCTHTEHSFDYRHEWDTDFRGNRIPCQHQVRCRHYKHRFDYLHNFDYQHDYDYEHDYDTQHEFDVPHEYDPQHEGDPIHEFDMAHEWDPVHDHDLAHDSDPVHDYDLR